MHAFDPATPPEPPPASVLADLSDEGFDAYETSMIEWCARAHLYAGSGPLLDVTGADPAIVEKLTDAIVAAARREARTADYMRSLLRETLR